MADNCSILECGELSNGEQNKIQNMCDLDYCNRKSFTNRKIIVFENSMKIGFVLI